MPFARMLMWDAGGGHSKGPYVDKEAPVPTLPLRRQCTPIAQGQCHFNHRCLGLERSLKQGHPRNL